MEQVKKVSLSELGAVLPPAPKVETETAKANSIITPNQVGGMNTETVNIGEVATYEDVVEPQRVFEQKEMDLIDEGIERVKKDLNVNVINPLKDKVIAARLESEAEAADKAEDPFEIVTPDVTVNQVEKDIVDNMDLGALDNRDRFSIDDEDLKDLLDDDETEEIVTEEDKAKAAEDKKADEKIQEEIFNKYQAQIKEVIKPIKNGINIKEFRISTKPIAVNHALSKAVVEMKTAQWGLYNTNQVITMSALNGDEIINLNPDNFETEIEAIRTAYSILYTHDISPNKPATFEGWLKSICGYDDDELYFTAYKATFGDSNYITYACDDCKDLDLRETKIDDMIRYSNDEFKAKYQQLLKSGNTSYPSLLDAKLVPVSDNYAFSFKAPSLYGMYFETSSLDKEFAKKYRDVLTILAFIDNVYYIDAETNTLVPIDCKIVPGNIGKTVRHKVVAYYNIIKKLTSDQYALISTEINKIAASTNKNNIIYQIPEADCTAKNKKTGLQCNHHFVSNPTPPLQMLFSRHRLVAIANYSKELG